MFMSLLELMHFREYDIVATRPPLLQNLSHPCHGFTIFQVGYIHNDTAERRLLMILSKFTYNFMFEMLAGS